MFKSFSNIFSELFELVKSARGNPITIFKDFVKILKLERLKVLFLIKLAFKILTIVFLFKIIR